MNMRRRRQVVVGTNDRTSVVNGERLASKCAGRIEAGKLTFLG
jgi:hypothetical protein